MNNLNDLIDSLAQLYRSVTWRKKKNKIGGEILTSLTPYFWKCIHSFSVPQEEQEDVFQDLSLDCFLVLDRRWKGGGSFSALLKSNIVNTLKNFWIKRSTKKRKCFVISLDDSYYSFLKEVVKVKIQRDPLVENEELSIVYEIATEREKRIMRYILDGLTYKEIGELLSIKPCTISLILKFLGERMIELKNGLVDDPVEKRVREIFNE